MADEKPGAAERTHITPSKTPTDASHSTASGTLFRPSQIGVATGTPAANTASTSTNSSSKSSASDWQLTNPSQWDGASASVLGVGSILKERFVLERVVGKGGMGTVFCARDRRKDEAQDRFPYVAVKILNEDFKKHPESLKLLQREARKAQQLAHPNIVTVYDFDRDGGNVFIVMELLQGQSLDRIIKEASSGMSFADALHIVTALGQALAYAHKKNVIHLDFKPANAYVLQDGSVKILDFGIAQARKRDDAPEAEQTKFRVDDLGALTPSYASLEMLDGGDPDPRDDIYALACVTYELLTGKHPFGRQPAKFAMEYNLKLVRPKGLSSRRWAALKNALAFKREDRTPSVEQFIAELTTPQRSSVLSWAVVASGVAMIAGAAYWTVQKQQPAVVPAAAPIPAVTTPVAPAPVVEPPDTAPQLAAQQELIDRRKEWLLQIAKGNDVQTAMDVLRELRDQLPADDMFVRETGPQAIAAANLRLADRAMQRGAYSSANDYLSASLNVYPSVSGVQPRREALTVISKLESTLRGGAVSVDAVRNQLMQVEEDIPASYDAVETNLANVLADRIQRARQSNPNTASTLMSAALQIFGQVPAIVSLNRSMEAAKQAEQRVVQPTPPPAPPVEKAVEQPPATQSVKPEPAPQPVVQQPVTPPPAAPKAEEKPKKKPDVIITF
jgi:predicted Ser/Thr protein kinase